MSETIPEGLPPFFDEDIPVDHRKCRLFGSTALVVQALMGVLVILSLVYKRHRETPKRPWRTWAFDVSKQVVGQAFVHGTNLLISGVGAHEGAGNPCAVYFLNILIDTTLGVGLIYFIHRFLTHLFSNVLLLKGFQSGQYGAPPSIWYWMRQVAVYVTSLSTMKLTVIGLFAAWPGIFKLGDWLLSWTGGGNSLQVIFVMGIFPIAMNILQFWLIDSIVKASSQDIESLPSSTPRHSADREPLFNATGSEDEDEGHASGLAADIENAPHASSSSQSIRSKTTLVEEPKYLSSRTSVDDPDEAEEMEMHSYPPRSSSARHSSLAPINHPRHSPISGHLSRKRSPPVTLELRPKQKSIHPAGIHVVAIDETPSPYHEQKMMQSADVTRPNSSGVRREVIP